MKTSQYQEVKVQGYDIIQFDISNWSANRSFGGGVWFYSCSNKKNSKGDSMATPSIWS